MGDGSQMGTMALVEQMSVSPAESDYIAKLMADLISMVMANEPTLYVAELSPIDTSLQDRPDASELGEKIQILLRTLAEEIAPAGDDSGHRPSGETPAPESSRFVEALLTAIAAWCVALFFLDFRSLPSSRSDIPREVFREPSFAVFELDPLVGSGSALSPPFTLHLRNPMEARAA